MIITSASAAAISVLDYVAFETIHCSNLLLIKIAFQTFMLIFMLKVI